MAQLRWTREAEQWLHDIYDYIALDNPDTAARVVHEIYDKVTTESPTYSTTDQIGLTCLACFMVRWTLTGTCRV